MSDLVPQWIPARKTGYKDTAMSDLVPQRLCLIALSALQRLLVKRRKVCEARLRCFYNVGRASTAPSRNPYSCPPFPRPCCCLQSISHRFALRLPLHVCVGAETQEQCALLPPPQELPQLARGAGAGSPSGCHDRHCLGCGGLEQPCAGGLPPGMGPPPAHGHSCPTPLLPALSPSSSSSAPTPRTDASMRYGMNPHAPCSGDCSL